MHPLITQILREEVACVLGTSDGILPWTAPLYFVEVDGHVYWKSDLGARHSLDLAKNPHASMTILATKDSSSGLQMEGLVHEVHDDVLIAELWERMISKRKIVFSTEVVEREITREDGRAWYCFVPSDIYLMHEPTLGYGRLHERP